MKISHYASLASICVGTTAFPLLNVEHFLPRQAPASYSVVAVDGGQPTGLSVQTVTDSLVQTSFTTILSTITLTQSNIPTTIVVTSTAAVTVTQAAAPVTVSVPAETKTVLAGGSMTSSPYDNGMWHTTYYSKWIVTTSIPLPVPTTSPSQSSVQTTSASIPTLTSSKSLIQPTSRTGTEESLPLPTSSSKVPTSVPNPNAAVVVISTTSITQSTPIAATAVVSPTTSLTQPASSAAATTDWATAYGQWHNHPNANGSWWW